MKYLTNFEIKKWKLKLSFLVQAWLQAVIGDFLVEAVDVVGLLEVDEVEQVMGQVLADELKAALLNEINKNFDVVDSRRNFCNLDKPAEFQDPISFDEEVFKVRSH